ncbi:MAG: hypothetical protein ALECFALPRED_005345 [Alectoria fallacina]|uniref:Uncharacterized protein n=1 Tax=Alectoria fallacina TaxID=1903189 RepID=A0A8H3FX50_9LECA|nr:MAG: hypothetical protein ALECFALPRED_005345 [Alectoria fallacina]
MNIRRLGLPWIRPGRMTELARKKSQSGERSSKVTPQEVYHRETQLGPFSEAEREIALQTGSLERSERAFKEFCRKLQEEDRNDQVSQEHQGQKENEPSLRSAPKMEQAHKEENPALEIDRSTEPAASYLRFCALNPAEDNGKERAVQTLPIQVRGQARESKIAPKVTGVDLVESSARKDRPTTEIHQTLHTQKGVREHNDSQ